MRACTFPFPGVPFLLLVEGQPHAQNTGEITKFAALVKHGNSPKMVPGMMFCFCLRNGSQKTDPRLVATVTTESPWKKREKNTRIKVCLLVS